MIQLLIYCVVNLLLKDRPDLLLLLLLLCSSQLALKYLDPVFTPLTSSLSEDLQNASKWNHNSTAFIQLR